MAESKNALAVAALKEIEKIREKAKADMEGQVDKIKEAKKAIRARIRELEGQEAELDEALASITGKAPAATGRTRTDLSELRARIVAWLASHKGEKFTAKALRGHFPELGDRPFSIVMKSEIGTSIKPEGKGTAMTYTAK